MNVRADIGAATLAFVTREVIGTIKSTKTIHDKETRENRTEDSEIADPVIIFFPTRSCLVMPLKEAERMGYLNQPSVLNIEAVTNAESIAGKYKFAINDEDRRRFWKMMENALIQSAIARSGYALPNGAVMSEKSLHLKEKKEMEITE